ncbi:MAG TPA: hypothetical protein VGY48_15370 [Vicinamibacterales bacterium]|jgi:hypothetical protein|nr:hypothetical protein [Vicinamibacterales bacterium]
MKRVKRPHGLLPKAPEKGEHITVVIHRAVASVHVRKASGGRDIRWAGLYCVNAGAMFPLQRVRGVVRRKDEGETWVRGWDTPAARALAVAVGLG